MKTHVADGSLFSYAVRACLLSCRGQDRHLRFARSSRIRRADLRKDAIAKDAATIAKLQTR